MHKSGLFVSPPPGEQGGLLHEGGDGDAPDRVLPDYAPGRRLAVGRAAATLHLPQGERRVRDLPAAARLAARRAQEG